MLNQENQANCDTNGTNSNYVNGKIAINVTDCSLRDMQVKCLIAYNALMNKSYRNFILVLKILLYFPTHINLKFF